MMTRRAGVGLVLLAAFLIGSAVFWVAAWSRQSAFPPATDMNTEAVTDMRNPADLCREIVFEDARALLCTVEPASYSIELVYLGADGAPYGSVAQAAKALSENGDQARALVLAMNAGMYHADMTPVGLYIENSIEIAPLNRHDGFGNFFLKPNGVFVVDADGGARVMETDAFQAAAPAPVFATQSGPMLVIDGEIHPRFLPDGTSKYTRNGVGVRADGRAVFAITRDPLSLGSFARLFRDAADCPNALFFDGAVSSLALGDRMVVDSGEPAGPIVAVFSIPPVSKN
jgi:uncharacterized protein YigE (DUF2233 family)